MRRHTEAKARDLRPCPFCGADAAVDRDKHGIIRSVDCSAICDLQHPVAVDWNSRPIEDALRARAEAAEAALAAVRAERAEAVAAAGAAAAVAQVASAEAERLRGELARAHQRLRITAQTLIDEVGAAGPMDAEVAAAAAADRLAQVREALRVAGIHAAVATHNAEAEPETAGEAWRTAHEATVAELRRALGVAS